MVEVITMEAGESGGQRGTWACGLEAYSKVVGRLHDDGGLVQEGDGDLLKPGSKLVSKRPLILVPPAPPGGFHR